jgi:hypothetical protein
VAQQATPDSPDRPDGALSEDDLEDVLGGVSGVVLADPLEINSGYPGEETESESAAVVAVNPLTPIAPVVYGPD